MDIDDVMIQSSQEQKIFGVLIDTNLSLKKDINNLCRRAGSKLFSLSRMSAYLETDKLKLSIKAFVTSNSNIVHWCGCSMAER